MILPLDYRPLNYRYFFLLYFPDLSKTHHAILLLHEWYHITVWLIPLLCPSGGLSFANS